MGANAIMLGGMADEGAPAAADVEQGFSGLEPQFAADHIELVGLRCRKIVVPVFEIGAGVDHLRIEKEFVKSIGEVVVIMDVLLVARLGAVDARLFAADTFQRPRAAAGHEYKPGERCKRERLVERFHQRPGAYFRPARCKVEKRSIAQIEPRRDPEGEESI